MVQVQNTTICLPDSFASLSAKRIISSNPPSLPEPIQLISIAFCGISESLVILVSNAKMSSCLMVIFLTIPLPRMPSATLRRSATILSLSSCIMIIGFFLSLRKNSSMRSGSLFALITCSSFSGMSWLIHSATSASSSSSEVSPKCKTLENSLKKSLFKSRETSISLSVAIWARLNMS